MFLMKLSYATFQGLVALVAFLVGRVMEGVDRQQQPSLQWLRISVCTHETVSQPDESCCPVVMSF